MTLVSGAALMVSGAWIKALSLAPDRFCLAFLGQAMVGTAQVFILGVPARLAAVWFGARQVSTACSLGVIGNQVRGEGRTVLELNQALNRGDVWGAEAYVHSYLAHRDGVSAQLQVSRYQLHRRLGESQARTRRPYR